MYLCDSIVFLLACTEGFALCYMKDLTASLLSCMRIRASEERVKEYVLVVHVCKHTQLSYLHQVQ